MGCNSSTAKAAGSPAAGREQVEVVSTNAQPKAPPVLTEATAEERALTQLKLVFDGVDADKDGAVSKAELTAALDRDQSLGALIKEAGLNLKYSVLDELDTNKDGSVSWEEFRGNLRERAVEEVRETGDVASAELPANEKVLKQLQAIFKSIDANEDGAVSKEELAVKLKADLGEHGLAKDSSFGQLVEEAGFNANFHTFSDLDTNGDGVISWDEFEANLRKAATEEVNQKGDVTAAAVLEDEKENSAAPVCGCW